MEGKITDYSNQAKQSHYTHYTYNNDVKTSLLASNTHAILKKHTSSTQTICNK